MAKNIKLTVEQNAVRLNVTRRLIRLTSADVTAPSSSVKGNLASWAGTNAKRLEDSGIPKTDVARLSQTNVFAEKIEFQNVVHYNKTITPTQLSANQNDYSPTSLSSALVMRLSSSIAVNITGIYIAVAASSNGRILFLSNIGSYTIILKKENASSTARNRFSLNADVSILTGQTVMLIYDSTLQRWRQIGTSSGGGSGTTPSGTGFRYIVDGTEDGDAKLVENADVASDAAIDESKLNLDFSTHNNVNDPTEDEKDALAGTSGSPSDTNRYVTNSDSRNTNARTPTSHTHIASEVTGLGTAALQNTDAFDAAGSADDVMSDHIENYNHLTAQQEIDLNNLEDMAFESDVASDSIFYARKNQTWVKEQEDLSFILGQEDGTPLETGAFVHIPIRKSFNVKNWSIGGNGSIQIDLWKKAGDVPTASDTMIGAGTKINLASETVNSGNTDDWEVTQIEVGDYMIANIVSVDGVMKVCPFSISGDKT